MAMDVGALDLRLGWLEAFLSAAHYQDYQLAGDELEMPAATVKVRVQRLEGWLRRILLLEHQHGLELADAVADEFAILAVGILTRFDDACAVLRHDIPVNGRSNLSLRDLQTVLNLAGENSYKVAAKYPEDVTPVRRAVKRLEAVFGRKIFSGYAKVIVLPDADCIVKTCGQIVQQLQDFRAPLQNNDTPRETAARYLSRPAKAAYVDLSANISVWEGRGRLKPAAKRDLEASLRLRDAYRSLLDECERTIGPPPSTSATHIDMDAFFRERSALLAPAPVVDGTEPDQE